MSTSTHATAYKASIEKHIDETGRPSFSNAALPPGESIAKLPKRPIIRPTFAIPYLSRPLVCRFLIMLFVSRFDESSRVEIIVVEDTFVYNIPF